eukprot:TRINITY_DN10006_c0_g1_i2.p1 TRINITY_DN10006_c0_g1~~TRINITY_DN10006_c0_g1_i2.p1  ORF type:complete len:157 (-),score=8.79 TRINITY_DN10006_c0_g1_i2:19-489(-)
MKDVRHKLREKPDQHLSPLIWSQSNGVLSCVTRRISCCQITRRKSRSSKPVSVTSAKKAKSKIGVVSVRDMQPAPVDKEYFRKFDGHSKYAESFFKDKVHSLLYAYRSYYPAANLSLIQTSSFLLGVLGFPKYLSLIHICRCRRYAVCRSRWSPYH